MEDYQAAFEQRTADVETLHTARRYTAAMHFGGVAVECFLKHMICTSLPKNTKGVREWKTDTNAPGHTISRPGHDYQGALNCHKQLKSRVQRFQSVQVWLNAVEKPDGHFINMRYSGHEPSDAKYKQWRKSYQSLIHWLQMESTRLGS